MDNEKIKTATNDELIELFEETEKIIKKLNEDKKKMEKDNG